MSCFVSQERQQYPSGYFSALVRRASEAKTLASEEIARDITRTLPRLKFSLPALQRVLNAYSVHDPTLGELLCGPSLGSLRVVAGVILTWRLCAGYCQGMNFLCGALLLLVPSDEAGEEAVFWTLVAIIKARRSRY